MLPEQAAVGLEQHLAHGKCSRKASAMPAIRSIKLVFGDLGDNVGKAFITVVIQHYGLSSEIYFLEGGGNKKGSCMVGKRKNSSVVEII